MDKEKIINALNKRAIGYDYDEVTEEFGDNKDGKEVLLKRKVNLKHMPPDITAIKILLDLEDDGLLADMTDKELEKEKIRLLNEIKGPSKARKRSKTADKE